MLRSNRLLVVGALWFSLAACGSSDDGTSGSGGQAGSGGAAGSGGSTTGIDCDPSAEVDLDGVFALRASLSFTFSSQPGGAVAVCPVDQVSNGSFLGLVRVQHDPGQTAIKSIAAVVCTLELPIISAGVGECKEGSNLVYAGLEFPQQLIDAFPLAVTATTTAELSALAPGSSLTPGPMNFSIGTNEAAATAPSWQMTKSGCGMNDNAPGRSSACESDCVTDCSLLEDDDADGWPGVTVHVCGFTDEDKAQKVPCNALEPNVAGATIQGRAAMNLQVEPLLLMGQALSSCEVAGNLDAAFGYNVVGSDLYLANTQISVTGAIKSLPVYTVNTQDSHFRLVRIDGKHGAPDWAANFDDPLTTCREVIKRQNDLY